jgi:integrase
MIDGKRVRYSFHTKEEAEGKAALLKVECKNEGTNGATFAARRFDLADAENAFKILSPHGFTFTEAADFYVLNQSIIREAKPVRVVVEELLRVKEQDGRSKRYLKDLRLKLANGFTAEFGENSVHEITGRQLDDWLRAHPEWSPLTRNNYATAARVLFAFALKRGVILKDPTVGLDRATVIVEKPGILSVDEARALLESAPLEFRAAVAIALFAGLRPESELMRLNWSQIDLGSRLIDVASTKNSASHRYVKISGNLAAWLRPLRRDSGALCPKGDAYYSQLQKTRSAAARKLQSGNLPHPSLDDWPQDAMRHTFASMHYAKWKNAAVTAEQMGHANGLRIFFRHYRNRVKEAEALAFWRLIPVRQTTEASQ